MNARPRRAGSGICCHRYQRDWQYWAVRRRRETRKDRPLPRWSDTTIPYMVDRLSRVFYRDLSYQPNSSSLACSLHGFCSHSCDSVGRIISR